MPLAPPSETRLPPLVADVPESHPAPGAGSAGAESAGVVTPAKVLLSLRRRGYFALPLAAALATLVYLGAESQVAPIYTARTLVHVGANQPSIVYDNVGGRSDTAAAQRTQIALAKSRSVRQAVVRDLGPADLAALRGKADPAAWLEKEIVADYTVAPEILRITMKGPDPDELVVLLNGVRDAYLREVTTKDRGERAARFEHLSGLAAKNDAALKDARQRVSVKTEAHGVRDFPELRAKYDRLVSQVHTLQTELLLARVGSAGADEQEAEPPPPDPAAVEAALEQAVAVDPLADAARKEVLRLEKKIADFERRLLNYQDEPDYKLATTDLATVRAALARRRAALRPAVADQLRARAPKPQPRGVGPDRLGGSKYQLPLLEAEIRKKEQEVAEVSRALSELELLRVEIVRHEEQLAAVNSKIRPLEVELQAPPRARVVEDAAIVETPAWSRSVKLAGTPAAAVFVAVLVLITWLDLRRGQVTGSADLATTQVRVIGAIPTVGVAALPTFAPPAYGPARDEYLRLTDAIDMARAVIAPVVAATPGYTLVVTSAAAGEGKTVLAGHLAAQFARSGLRTLLIDADVRRPRLHRLFGLPAAPGLGEWVSGGAERPEITRPTTVPGLDVLPAGAHDPRAVVELLDLRFPELLESLRREYDVIVLDTAPLLSTPEALTLSRAADGVLLAVMRDVSRVPGVAACADRLAAADARVLGAVVTGEASARYGPA